MAKPLAKLVNVLTRKRRWAQFSLATMLAVVTVLCVGLRLIVVPSENQRRAVAAIEALGGSVEYYDPNQEPDPEASETFPRSFLRRWLSRDYLDEVVVVFLDGSEATDNDLKHLQGLKTLKLLSLNSTQVTDGGLAHLKKLTFLEYLDIAGTQVTDAGLAHLRPLNGLQCLTLNSTQVTDAGLVHLDKMMGMQELDLIRTRVTDAGLTHLKGFNELHGLLLGGTRVTEAGVAKLQQALPSCRIVWR